MLSCISLAVSMCKILRGFLENINEMSFILRQQSSKLNFDYSTHLLEAMWSISTLGASHVVSVERDDLV